MCELTHLDLFSGIGGFALAFQRAGFRTIGFCEIEPYAQRVLEKNFGSVMADAEFAEQRRVSWQGKAKIHADITKLDGWQFRGVTVITGGFPCQPFSVAGKRRGAADDRALWPEMRRVIEEARPDWVLGENVPGIINMELDRVLSDLETLGYATRTFVVPACAVDARHRRDRVWIVAHNGSNDNGRADGAGRRGREQGQDVRTDGRGGRQEDVLRQPERGLGGMADGVSRWMDEPAIPRTSKGDKNRTARLRGLGNAVVPQVVEVFARMIAEMERL